MCTVHRTGNLKAWKRVVFFIHRQCGNNRSTLGWRHLESLYMSPFYSKSLCCSLVLNLWVTESLISPFHSRFVFFLSTSPFLSHLLSPLNHDLQILVSDSGLTRALGHVDVAQSLSVIREDGWEAGLWVSPCWAPFTSAWRASCRSTSHLPIRGSSL